MDIAVYHHRDPSFALPGARADLTQYAQVGKFPVLPGEPVEIALENAFAMSQNGEGLWRADSPCRSTSVGDLMEVGGVWFVVAPVGFKLVQV